MQLYLVISLFFSPIAALMAYIITYEEYKKHLSRKKAIKHSLETAVFTAIIFIVIGVAGGYLFRNFS